MKRGSLIMLVCTALMANPPSDCTTGLRMCDGLVASLQQENTVLKQELVSVKSEGKPLFPEWVIFGMGFISAAIGAKLLTSH
jgi:hypothetical protein